MLRPSIRISVDCCCLDAVLRRCSPNSPTPRLMKLDKSRLTCTYKAISPRLAIRIDSIGFPSFLAVIAEEAVTALRPFLPISTGEETILESTARLFDVPSIKLIFTRSFTFCSNKLALASGIDFWEKLDECDSIKPSITVVWH